MQVYVLNEEQRRECFLRFSSTIVEPSLDLVIYKMGGNNGQYDPTFTNIPQPEPSTARDDWKPIQGTPFIEGSRAGDDGIRRVLEMVSAAVRMN